MKIVQINTTCGAGSTGKICVAVSKLLTEANIENFILYTCGNSDYSHSKKYMTASEIKIQALRSRIFGNYGFQSKAATKRLIAELDSIGPDVVHLHNLHGHNVHLGDLFTYFKNRKIKVFWTFHDCWAFTAYCPHFVMAGCDKWRTGCNNCPQRKNYTWFFDRSVWLYKKKIDALRGLDLTIVTPSHWLAELVKESFFKEYPLKVIYNGIDLNVFRPRSSDFRERYGIADDQFIILGVADRWSLRKGIDIFVELSKRLTDRFKIVLVGTDDTVDKQLPANIISVHRTSNQIELAEIYTAADLFVNPTREDTFPTVNIESLACGTPVITFNTGGSAEMLSEKCGFVVNKNDIDTLLDRIVLCQEKNFSKDDCLARAENFDQRIKFEEYISLYE